MTAPTRILVIAGSDSGGGAGIQADIKTISALGGYAATAVTALTAQNSLGVSGVLPVPPVFVREQIDAVISDIGADAIKTGMLVDAETVNTVADAISGQGVPIIVDPVQTAKGGAALVDDAGLAATVERLFPVAAVVAPNLEEAAAILGRPIEGAEEMKGAAADLLAFGPKAVLLKGGHGQGERLTDVLVWQGGMEVFESERINTPHTHGTGCTTASAIAVGLGEGLTLEASVARALRYVRHAILEAPGFGEGHGPLWHGHGKVE